MFRQVFIVQCKSTGEFITHCMQFTFSLNRAGFFTDKQSALDTAINELDNDFAIYDFYKKDSDLPYYMG